jgi:acetylornithine/succinyldiaminopimelate/putrescine aminotransferase
MTPLEQLDDIAWSCPARAVDGLPREVVEEFLRRDPALQSAIDAAHRAFDQLRHTHPILLTLPEDRQVASLVDGFVGFYDESATNPYVPLAGRGPWVVTTGGAVIHDSGGYGMLAFGHAPSPVIDALTASHIMANVMTANLEQQRFIAAVNNEIGHTRADCKPVYHKYACLASGSEIVGLAMRISDTRAKTEAERRGINPSAVKIVSLHNSFHGRTDRPARASGSSRTFYTKHLASFAEADDLITVEPDSVESLVAVFDSARRNNEHIEAVLVEPVMGEGAPGRAISPEYYAAARELTAEHGAMLIVDSVQAGLRTHGCLSIVDYPGFQNVAAPDMETFAKALNGGQYPVSVLALSEIAARTYVPGTYGNTMTANPRGLAVISTMLGNMTPEVRQNIRLRGQDLKAGLQWLQRRMPHLIRGVTGTGLLLAAELNPILAPVAGPDGVGRRLRTRGIGFISGGENGLRFTPHFQITPREITLIVDTVGEVLSTLSQEAEHLPEAAGDEHA